MLVVQLLQLLLLLLLPKRVSLQGMRVEPRRAEGGGWGGSSSYAVGVYVEKLAYSSTQLEV